MTYLVGAMSRDLSKVRAIVFDLDNTLMDFMKMKESAIDGALDAMIDAGLRMEKKKALAVMNSLFDKYGIEHQHIFNVFLEEVTGSVDNRILAAGVVAYRRVKEGYVQPYPNVTATLLELLRRGYKLGIISDAPSFQAWTRLAGMNLHHFFRSEHVVTLDDTGVRKPDELPFKAAMDKLRLNPEEMLFVGDDLSRDIAGAKGFRIITALAQYGCWKNQESCGPEEAPDFILNDISELLTLLPMQGHAERETL
ncbi:MAG: HAD-IA family hydrolase [Candidatus Bathyarchaeia archaeon]